MTSKIKSMFSRLAAQCLKPAFAIFAACIVGALASPTSALADAAEIAATLNNATAADNVVVTLAGETVEVDSITAASLTVNGTGEITVTGDINVSGAVTFTPDSSYTLYATYDPTYYAKGYTLKLTADGMSAGTLNGAAAIVTTSGLTAAGGTFYGKVTGDISSSGNFTLQAPQTVSGELNVTAGTLTVGPRIPSSYGLHLDASDTSNMTITDGRLTAFTTPNGASTRTWSSTGTAYATVGTDDNYFGGTKPVMVFNANAEYAYTSGNLRYDTLFAVYQTNQEAPSSDKENVLFTSRNSEDNDKIRFGIYKKDYQTSRSKWYGWNNSNSQASNYTWPIFLDGSNSSTSFTTGKKSVLSFASSHPGPNTRGIQIGYDAVTFVGAVAEIIGLDYTVSLEERAAIEAYLMQKWDCTDKANFTMLASTAEVTLSSGSTLDLGGYAQTVKSLSGSGTVQNGTLTVTDAINLSAGEVLALPNTAVFTLGTVAAKIVSGDSSTVTLYGSLADAIVAQNADSTGTLTITASATDVVLGATEIAGVTATLADGVTAPTFAATPPYSASYTDGTIANARVASTYVWTPTDSSTDWASLSNWRIGEAVPVALPGSSDEVSFTTSCTVELSSTVQLAKLTIADGVRVCISADSLTAVELGDYGYGDTSTLALANIRLYPISKTSYYSLEIGGIIEIVAGTSNEMRANATRVDAQTKPTHALNVSGSLTGTGTVAFRAMNSTNRSTITLGGDNSDFEGTVNIIGDKSLFFVWDSAASGSAKAAWTVKKTDGNFSPKFGFTTGTIYFGSMDTSESTSTVAITTATRSTDGVVVEIGALNSATDVFEGSWADGTAATGKPSVRKVGSGALTAAFTDTAAYILNGGSLVLASSDNTACSTEMAGYEVVSTTDSDAGTTTYTLKSNKITWTGEGGDSNWTTAGNWSGNAVPTATDFVVFEGNAEVVVPTWATSMCKYMTVNGNVTLAGAALTDNCYCLDVHGGYIDGRGTLTLRNCGLWNPTASANVVISVDVAVESTGNRARFSRIESDNGTFTITGNITVDEGSKLKLKNVTATEPTITLDVGAWLVVPSSASVSTGKIGVSGGAYSTSTDGTAPAYVNNTVSSWIGGASGSWATGSCWSTGIAPGTATAVTFPAAESQYTVAADDGVSCGSITVSGNVLLNHDTTSWASVNVYGDISGEGTLTLGDNLGLRSHKAGTFTISSPLCIAGSSQALHNWISTEGGATTSIAIAGSVTLQGFYQPNMPTTFSGPVYVTSNSTVENMSVAVAFTGTVSLSDGVTLTVPEGTTFVSGQPSTAVEGKKVSTSSSDGKTYYWLDAKSTVTVSPASVTYGADFATATVTVELTGEATSGDYKLTVGGTTYNATAENGSVTFENVATGHSTAYDSFSYTVSSDDVTVSGDAASGSKTIADVADWFSTSASGTTGGSWSKDMTWTDSKTSVGEGDTFTPVASDASVVDVALQVCFGDANDDAIELADAKAAVKIATVKVNDVDTLVFQALNNGTFVTLTGVTPDAATTYNVALHLDYAARKYTVKIGETMMHYAESTEEDKTLLAMANDAAELTAVAFQGQGTLTSLVGETSEGYVAMDAAGNRYATLEAAMTAGNADATKLPLTVLHDGTFGNETYAKSKQVLPTGVNNNVSITAASQEAANAAAANMEIALTSAQVTQGLKKDYYKAVATKSGEGDTYTLSIELDEDVVAPTVADGTNKAMEVTASGVKLNVTDAKAGLYYGIAASDSADVSGSASSMTKCESDGELNLPAIALPENGVKYYKVIVDD